MPSRRRLLALLAAAPFAVLGRDAAAATPRIDVIARLRDVHRVAVGRLTGAYVVAPAGMVNWYFANTALTAIHGDLSPTQRGMLILPHLDLAVRRLTATATLSDVEFVGGDPTAALVLHRPDSHDSYAATLLSLAARLQADADGRAWLAAHVKTLETLAEANLLSQQKPSSLIAVFQKASGLSQVGYFMDGCEDLAGLLDLASVLDRCGRPLTAARCRVAAVKLVAGLKSLWDPTRLRFRASDAIAHAGAAFYPDATCQIFPEALGLTALQPLYAAGWKALNLLAPTWSAGTLDSYPWMMLGWVAAQRGARSPALRQMALLEARLPLDPAHVPIHDLGFYHRTRRRLGV